MKQSFRGQKIKHVAFGMAFIVTVPWITACNAEKNTQNVAAGGTEPRALTLRQAVNIERLATFDEPWAMQWLPDGRLLVTERRGQLQLFNPVNKAKILIQGTPEVAYGGQGGLGDVLLHPDFAQNHQIYLSYAEAGQGGYGAAIAKATLDIKESRPALKDLTVIWRQVPKVSGQGHYAHKMLFGADGKLWVSSGERQKFDPAQDLQSNLGKILRLNENGTPAAGNPFQGKGDVAKQIWTLGHRNPLGLAFNAKQQLWTVEMGPKGGDELNQVLRAENYGYPIVSNGDHYDGTAIPDHSTRPEFQAPAISWTPVISPSSLIFYQGHQFPHWKDKALIGGLSSEAIIIADVERQPAQEIQRLKMNQRIRDLIEGADGSIWVLEDGKRANLLKLTAK